MRFGLMTLGDLVDDAGKDYYPSDLDRHRLIVESAIAAEAAGFWSINVGEHHACEYVVSAPPVVLGAIASRTTELRLGTSVTLLANLDPVRVAEDYNTLDLISDGRVELIAGRGNYFAHTYELFDQSLEDSRALFDESVDLLMRIWASRDLPLQWNGKVRPPIDGYTITPRSAQLPHPGFWVGGGGSKGSSDTAARHGLGLMLPSAFGNPENYRESVDFYLDAFARYGHTDVRPQVGGCWHVSVRETSQEARDEFRIRYRRYYDWNTHQHARLNPTAPSFKRPFDFDQMTTQGPAIVGSPDEVVDRICSLAELLSVDYHLVYLDLAGLPPGELMAMIELFGAKVISQINS
jgi:alkanesulfonate monooxygenase SsuD/methylene tetrahydromethanopterin reductase-like flavin-dependent oxidoreductase (luciferase family)